MQNHDKPNSVQPHDWQLLAKDIQNTAKTIAVDFLTFLEEKHNQNRQSLADFIEQFSHTLDNTILATERNEVLNYQAGNIFLRIVEEKSMQFHADLYYQNEQGSWINKKIESPVMDMEIYLTQEAIDELAAHQEMKFSVAKPQI